MQHFIIFALLFLSQIGKKDNLRSEIVVKNFILLLVKKHESTLVTCTNYFCNLTCNLK